MQAQTAQKSGFVEGSIFTKLSSLPVGASFNIEAMPEYTEHDEYGTQASIQTNIGTVQTNNRKTIGSLKSTTPKSLGDLIARSLEKNLALTVFVREEEANTGRKQKVISPF